MRRSTSSPKQHAFFVFPETAVEMLSIVEAYSEQVAKHPQTDFELVLFYWTLRPAEVVGVLESQDRLAASEKLLAHYVDLLD